MIFVFIFLKQIPELKKKINSFTYYPYRIKKNSDKLVGCVAWRQKILMYIPLNGKKEREIVLENPNQIHLLICYELV